MNRVKQSLLKSLLLAIITAGLFTCVTRSANIRFYDQKTTATEYKEKIILVQHGFRYTVPQDMEEYPDAFRFHLRNLIVFKSTNYYSSPMIIAIRQTTQYPTYSATNFAKIDQQLLKKSRKIYYDRNYWQPAGLKEKNIDYASYQFHYFYGEVQVFQRSVYIKCEDTFYIVSLASKDKLLVIHNKNDQFWNSIYID